VFNDSGVVGEEAEPAVYGTGGVAYVYAGYAAVCDYAVGFAPGFCEGFVHGVVDFGYGFLAAVGFQFLLERGYLGL
jgi:hypothetical protein